MPGFTVSENVAAPRDAVFAVAADIAAWERIISGVKKIEVLTEGPVGEGTRFRETRTMLGKEATEEMTVTEFDPPGHCNLVAESHGCRYVTQHVFEEVTIGSTKVSLTFEGQPIRLMAKLMAVFMKPMMNACRKACEQDLHDLKAAIE